MRPAPGALLADPDGIEQRGEAMAVFDLDDFDGHEQVVFAADPESGLQAILAIHDTGRGPALGGCRMWRYRDDVEAVRDALRLSRGMTYKAAVADLALGGGKSVILAPEGAIADRGALFRALGQAVDRLGGRYIVAEDVGTSPDDMADVAEETAHVVGLAPERGGRGDPSPITARGVFTGLKSAVAWRLGRDDLDGVTVAVQGLGHVGWHLCTCLKDAGARLIVADIDVARTERAREELGAVVMAPAAIVGAEADVFAPCALGAVIDDKSVPRLAAKVVAGAANNQLAENRHGAALKARGILYAPDYVINAGGLIHVAAERFGHDAAWEEEKVAGIGRTLTEIFQTADREGLPTSTAADRVAEKRFRPHRREVAAA